MKKSLGIVGVISLGLVSCGITPDFSLLVGMPTLKTEWRTQGGTFVGCDEVRNGEALYSTKTQVRASFSAVGELDRADLNLQGEDNNSTIEDDDFVAVFRKDNGLENSGDDYTVLFDANSATGNYLPAGVGQQGIIVKPTPRNIKVVSVREQDRPYLNAGFHANLVGYSLSGQSAIAPQSNTIPVYRKCTLISENGPPL